MDFLHLTSKNNLELAWRRITTTKDARYKNYFRQIMEAYEVCFKDNISDLQQRLRTKEYTPQPPVRIYYPKPSGLQRPISLLCLEDQIVLQAIANIFSEKVQKQREPLIGLAVYSNWLTKRKDSEFFLNDWKYGYHALRKSILQWYQKEYCWVANFDLASFYDTIPHELLLKVIAPHGGSPDLTQFIGNCLFVWSADCNALQHNHGIPQGPTASDFLAECVMLPIDLRMHQSAVYLRYVDDIRILGSNELDVRKALVDLDVLCRERGLIPSSEKTSIKRMENEDEVVQNIPPILLYNDSSNGKQFSTQKVSSLLNECVEVDANEIRILDKSKLRYLLFRSGKSQDLLNIVLSMWEHYPHFIDAFVSFLENYDRVEEIVSFCMRDVRLSPYDYVRGEAWKLLARMSNLDEIHNLTNQAVLVISTGKSPATRVGAYQFLNRCEELGLGAFCKWSMYEDSPIIQAMTASNLCLSGPCCTLTVEQILRRRSIDPSLALMHGLLRQGITMDLYQNGPELLPITKFVYSEVGLMERGRVITRDIVGNKLARRYKIAKWRHWCKILGSNFAHAHEILTLAESSFKTYKSSWLTYQDAFNDALFRGFQAFLTIKNAPGRINTVDSNGKLIDYGNLIHQGPFKNTYPNLAGHLIAVHSRRSSVPSAHPFDKRTGMKTKPLKSGEQRQMAAHLAAAYSEIIRIVTNIGI